MHKILPNFYIFLDHYNKEIFKKKYKNIGIIYRNYKSKNRKHELNKIAIECKKRRYAFFVSNDLKLAVKFKADGLYIPAFNKTKKYYNLENRNIAILGSAHSQKEIKKKISQNCKKIFISPIFNIKKRKNFLGIHQYNFLSYLNKITIMPLGGITEYNYRKLKLVNAEGFGGIGIFKKKPASKRPVFLKNNFF
jgi:thiamine monophosphate synthase